jgi:hypothetical protein
VVPDQVAEYRWLAILVVWGDRRSSSWRDVVPV